MISIPLLVHAVRPSRNWVRETLVGWGLGDVAEPGAQITSELVTNALLHARGESRIVLLLMYAAGTVRLEVRDGDTVRLPSQRNPAESDIEGRGLIIVEALSDRWGVRVTDSGKSVWAELDLMPRATTEESHGSAGDREAGR